MIFAALYEQDPLELVVIVGCTGPAHHSLEKDAMSLCSRLLGQEVQSQWRFAVEIIYIDSLPCHHERAKGCRLSSNCADAIKQEHKARVSSLKLNIARAAPFLRIAAPMSSYQGLQSLRHIHIDSIRLEDLDMNSRQLNTLESSQSSSRMTRLKFAAVWSHDQGKIIRAAVAEVHRKYPWITAFIGQNRCVLASLEIVIAIERDGADVLACFVGWVSSEVEAVSTL